MEHNDDHQHRDHGDHHQEHHDHHHHPDYHLTIDHKPFSWPREIITGNEIKELVQAKPEYGVWRVIDGPGDDEEVGDHQRVHLKKDPKENIFITGPKKSTEGQDSFLPLRDREYLASKGIKYEEVASGGLRGVIFRQYPLPSRVFDATQANILVILPPGYADTPPDMFHLMPWVRIAGRNAYPRAADQSVSFNGQNWQRWSRHNPEWRPGVDGIWTMLKRIDHALKVAA
jgi:hypothetical protein